MSVVISDEIVRASQMSETELIQELVLMLFQRKKIGIGKASRLLGMNLIQFQHLMASRDLCVHYDVEDFKADVATVQRLQTRLDAGECEAIALALELDAELLLLDEQLERIFFLRRDHSDRTPYFLFLLRNSIMRFPLRFLTNLRSGSDRAPVGAVSRILLVMPSLTC